MSRPRNTFPAVRRRRRGKNVFLRIWFEDRWHPVGREGDREEVVRDRVLAIIQKKVVPVPETYTVPRLFADFLDSPDAPSDHRDYENVKRAGTLLSSYLGVNVTAASLTASQFEAWRDWLCQRKAMRGSGRKDEAKETDRTLSAQQINRMMKFTRRVYRFALKKKTVPAAVIAELDSVQPPAPGKARRSPGRSAADPAALKKIMPFLPQPYRAMLTLQRATGMRPSEMCRMISKEVHRSGTVAIPGGQSINLDRDGRGCWLWVPDQHKTASRGKVKAVVIPPECHKEIEPYLKNYQTFPVTGTRYTRVIVKACRDAKVSRVTAYMVRHTVGTETAAAGGLHAVMQRLGHSNPATAARYVGMDLNTVFKIGVYILDAPLPAV